MHLHECWLVDTYLGSESFRRKIYLWVKKWQCSEEMTPPEKETNGLPMVASVFGGFS